MNSIKIIKKERVFHSTNLIVTSRSTSVIEDIIGIFSVLAENVNTVRFFDCKRLIILSLAIGVKSSTFNPLVGLIITYVDMNKNSDVDIFLKELKDLSESKSAYKIKYNYKIAKAYSLKNNQDIKESQNSKLMFKELANNEKIKFNKRAFCIINYCDISLRTINHQNLKEGIQEIKKLIKNLVKLAQKSFAFLFLAQYYLILAHIALIEGNIDEAQKNIIKSELISKEKNFLLNKKIETLKVQINKLDSIPKVSDVVLSNLKKKLDSMILTRR